MNIHADFSQKVVVDTTDLEWIESPVPGVKRKYLDRIGDGLARASSLVGPAIFISPHPTA